MSVTEESRTNDCAEINVGIIEGDRRSDVAGSRKLDAPTC